jgi:hypothetical protein
MPPSRRRIRAALIACALVAAVLPLASCGGGGEKTQSPPPVARPQDFPKPNGRTLGELLKMLGPGPVLSQSVSVLEPGQNRFGFGLFDRARRQIADAAVALYVAPAPGGKVTSGTVKGPYPARWESLAVKPAFQSQTAAKDPDAAKSVYVAHMPFKTSGQYAVIGVVRLDNRLAATDPVGVKVSKGGKIAAVGTNAPKIHTPTAASAGGDLSKIDTRTPHDDMHDVDLAAALGKKPVILVFATPALCQSRVCGPVVDIALQLQAKYRDQADFIHMEIYNDNEVAKGARPQVGAFHLPSEPWLFTVDKQGKIAARVEGAFSADELEAAIKKALKD